MTRHQRGFKQFTRPVFPSPVAPGWNRSPWAFPPSFAPRPHGRRTSGWGQAIEHGPETTLYVIDLASKPASFTRNVRPRVALVKAALSGRASLVAQVVRKGSRRRPGRRDRFTAKRAAAFIGIARVGACQSARVCICRAADRAADQALSRFVVLTDGFDVHCRYRGPGESRWRARASGSTPTDGDTGGNASRLRRRCGAGNRAGHVSGGEHDLHRLERVRPLEHSVRSAVFCRRLRPRSPPRCSVGGLVVGLGSSGFTWPGSPAAWSRCCC